MNQRFSVRASSLGNYFGVGFINPMEQLKIDLGEKERLVFEKQRNAMDLGSIMEEPLLNYWETKLGIEITDRNQEVFTVLDGMLRCKIDGKTIYDGVPTIVECKYTNGTSSFVDDKGYLFQTHAYMLMGYDQTLLLGAFNGKPDMKLIKFNEDMGRDIEEMVFAVFSILNGFTDETSFPWYLVKKYSTSKLPDLSEGFADFDKVYRYMELSEEIKQRANELEEIAEELKNAYESGEIMTERGKVSISIGSRKGGLDEQALRCAFPQIDFDSYRKPDSSYKTIRISKVKSKA